MQEILPDGGLASFQHEVSKLADLGRYEDAYIVHAAEGETIVPMAVFDENPRLKEMLFAQMRGMGIDPQRYIVGNEFNSINPITGQPEFFLKKIFKEAKKAVKKLAPYAGTIAGIAGLGPMGSAIVGAGVPLLMGEDMSTAIAGGLGGYGAGTAFGSRFGSDPNYVFKGGFEGSLGRMKDNLGFGKTAGSEKLLTDAQAEALNVPKGTSVQEMIEIGKIKNPASAKDFAPWMKTASAFAPAIMEGMKPDDSPMGMPSGWDNIYPNNPWYGNWAAPGATYSANGGIIQKFENGGKVDIDIKEIEDLMEYYDWTQEEAEEWLINKAKKDMNTGGIVQLAEGTGPRGVHPGTEQEGYQYDFDVDGENRTYSFDEPGLTDLARREFLAREGITEMTDMLPGVGGVMSGAIMKLAKLLKPEGRLNRDDMTRAGEMLVTMDPMQLARLMKTAGRINIDDIQQAEEMQMKLRESEEFDVRKLLAAGDTRNEYTESKYADGGIAHLSAGAFPRMTGAIAGPGGPKDDMVPAMLSDGEFVMTAEAVRNAGGGDRREGARRMYQLMNQLQGAA